MLWLLLTQWLSRQAITRTLCAVAIASGVLTIVVVLSSITALLASEIRAPALKSAAPFVFFACILVWLVCDLLLNVPSCTRCSRRLFCDAPRGSWSSPIARDYQAKQFLFSYRAGAVIELARTGRLHCQWCGHLFGEKPDYVVISAE
jgi:hypothetical protein